MLIKWGAGIIEGRGSIAGMTASRNKSGAIIRARTKPVNPRSDRQSEARVRIQMLAEYWHSAAMSNAERGSWEAYAAAVAWNNGLGETIRLSGFNHFVRSNASLLAAGGAIVEPGPEEQALPEADETLAVAGDNGTQFLTVAFDIAKLWALETGGYLLVEMSMPQLHTRNSAGSHWRVAAAIAGIDTTGVTSPQNIVAPFTLTTNQKIWCRASIIRKDGRTSNKFYAPAFLVGGLLPKYFITCDPAPVPDCMCNYILGGAFNGKAYYKRATGGFYIWWDGVDTWNISEILGTPGAEFWTLATESPVGIYTLGGTATGAPEVAPGEHPL